MLQFVAILEKAFKSGSMRKSNLNFYSATSTKYMHQIPKNQKSVPETLIISNEKKNDIMKIIKSLEESGLLMKGVSKTIKNEAKKQKNGFLGMVLGTLGASLLGNLLAGKGVV